MTGYDQFRPENVNDLQRFYDRYAKGVQNGWETDTPRVRLSMLGFDGSPEPTVIERPEQTYPVERTMRVTYFLDAAAGSLSASAPTAHAQIAHEGHSLTATSDFVLHFDRRTEVAGYAKVKLYMSCDEHDDMDVVVQLRKVSKQGTLLKHNNFPVTEPIELETSVTTTLGAQGQLRASHAVSRDDTLSTDPNVVVYKHDKREPVPRGTIVPLEITPWPMGMVFGPGEGIMLRVSGHHMGQTDLPHLPPPTTPQDANVGVHTVHTGGKYASCLVLPILPE